MTRECSAAQAWELLRAQREPGKGTAAKVSRALRGPSEEFERDNSKLHLQLTHERAAERRRAVAQLQERFSAHLCHDQGVAADVLASWYGKALLKRMTDVAEAVRTEAVAAYLTALRTGPDAMLPLLPYTIPVLEELLDREEHGTREPSEDVRFALLQVLQLVLQLAGNAIAAYTAEVLSIVRARLEDPYHAVAICACECMATLARTLGRRLQPTAKEVTAAVLPLTTHRRKAVRCAAVRAVRDLMFCGAHEMLLEMVAWRDPNVVAIKAFYQPDPKVNFCGKLSMDACHAVRLEFVGALGAWLLGLDERIDHQGRLLPYLLTATFDDHAAVRERAVDLIERIGELYERDNATDLKEALTYLPEAAHNVGWAEGGVARDPWALHAAGRDVGLPAAFRARPRIGARRVVAANFGHIAHAIASELGSWRHECRWHAARLLLVYLSYVEDWVLQYVHELVPALCRALVPLDASADGLRAVEAARACCERLGVFAPCERVLQIAAERAADASSELPLRAAALEAMAAVARGRARVGGVADVVPAVLDCIEEGGLPDAASAYMRRAVAGALGAVGAHPEALTAEQQRTVANLLGRARGTAAAAGDAPDAAITALANKLQDMEPPGLVDAQAERVEGDASAERT